MGAAGPNALWDMKSFALFARAEDLWEVMDYGGGSHNLTRVVHTFKYQLHNSGAPMNLNWLKLFGLT